MPVDRVSKFVPLSMSRDKLLTQSQSMAKNFLCGMSQVNYFNFDKVQIIKLELLRNKRILIRTERLTKIILQRGMLCA